jgi:CRISPR-associated endonuclease Cas2
MSHKKPKKTPLTFLEKLRLIKNAGLNARSDITISSPDTDPLEDLDKRIRRIMNIYNLHDNNPGKMIYFIMYDIEHNKIRTQISKYLIKKGCTRVQKSIFLAQTDRSVFNEIHTTIKEVQEIYDNNDSIFFVPVSADQLRAMKIVGQSVDMDLIMDNKNTLFF